MADLADRIAECATLARKAKTLVDDYNVHSAWSKVFDYVPASAKGHLDHIHDLLFEIGELKVKARGPYRALLAKAFDDLAEEVRGSNRPVPA